MSLREVLLGRPLRTEEEQAEQIGPAAGVALLGLDALASASYGPEAALTVLLPAGALACDFIGIISACIIGVLLAAFFSYWQTIPAYPNGGGSYTVAKENLGPMAGLLAASALSIDYVLNVAVAISAGVGALVSAVPVLLPHTLALCLVVLVILATINLRGVRSAGLFFMAPTYLFVLSLTLTVVMGVIKVLLAHGHPVPVIAPPHVPATIHVVSMWLFWRAFASGCSALTGVEAVSNSVPVFRQPTVPLAQRTLAIIVGILGFLLAGVAFLSYSYGIQATPPGQPGYQSVLSQILAAVLGRGGLYYLAIVSILLVLTLSANTSFAGFPRVCRILALDEYLPAEFAHRGSRLVYTSGIVVLTVCSAALLVAFGGITDRLIPLFAIGAFLAFTLSQIGMVVHWRGRREREARRSLIFNAVGALATASTLVIITVSKFMEGAWITLLVIPPLILLYLRIKRYHARLSREIEQRGPIKFGRLVAPAIVIPLKRLDRAARKAIRLAVSLSDEVIAVQILSEEMQTQDLRRDWGELVEEPARRVGIVPPKLAVVPSAYREFFRPLLRHLRQIGDQYRNRGIAVMLPEVVERRWYHFLFRRRTTILKGLLLLKGGPRITIMTAPWYVSDALPTDPSASNRRPKKSAVVTEPLPATSGEA